MRSLVDTGLVEFRPITLLLGQNSSGKSTFLRALPLVKQSIRTRSNAPLLWYGDFVDFGSIAEVMSTFASTDGVNVGFSVNSLPLRGSQYYYHSGTPRILNNVCLEIELFEHEESTRLRGFSISIGDDKLTVAVDLRGVASRLEVNAVDYTNVMPGDRYRFLSSELVPHLTVTQRSVTRRPSSYYIAPRPWLSVGAREIFDFYSARLHNRISHGTIRDLAQRVIYAPGDQFEAALSSARSSLKSWGRFVADIVAPYSKGDFDRLRSLYLIAYMPEILGNFSSIVVSDFQNLSYIGPSRATGERYYRHQELAVDQIDPQGRNLAMFLYSLSSAQKDLFSKWLEEAIGYSIKIIRASGHIQIELRERGSEASHNLADMGYGFSQVLPVMAQIWARQLRGHETNTSPFVTIEQPELHLHPAYQARLGDVFTKAVRSSPRATSRGLTFVIETHSEALINRLGELIYKGQLSSEAVAVYLFEREASSEPARIRRTDFDEKGILTNWPIGFFSSAV